ncbi:MAG: glutaredoxin family protein [Methylibium sp.]|uniref:glutaredoxin family protein n=1 Tax=Methylibium sp. TaxID=2067992 RepID=UPI0017B846AA|nr:glutaredoxin family protein [Methylibium sp.]MBA3597524.1 glutaredoxin family protein [Methylibium sp.]
MSRRPAAALFALSALMVSTAPQAQYKVVEPDGRVTYTDRPSLAGAARVAPLSLPTDVVASGEALPAALQQPAARFPVTLYTMPTCAPCDNGRNYLRRRGVPFAEKTVTTLADSKAFQSLNLGTEVPVLRIGQQVLRNFSETTWANDLDLAGYPATSRLPNGYRGWEPMPLAMVPPPGPPAVVRAPETPAALPPALEATPNGIRF